jgi:hypothetical protein
MRSASSRWRSCIPRTPVAAGELQTPWPVYVHCSLRTKIMRVCLLLLLFAALAGGVRGDFVTDIDCRNDLACGDTGTGERGDTPLLRALCTPAGAVYVCESEQCMRQFIPGSVAAEGPAMAVLAMAAMAERWQRRGQRWRILVCPPPPTDHACMFLRPPTMQ